jgi:hypothetical protein
MNEGAFFRQRPPRTRPRPVKAGMLPPTPTTARKWLKMAISGPIWALFGPRTGPSARGSICAGAQTSGSSPPGEPPVAKKPGLARFKKLCLENGPKGQIWARFTLF